ncbi:DUF4097 family beta strand repeat-containing protein [Brevibacterium otitidis]|uniref:DUF4097 family beta strand repeat-containing protein n=1 Tax=Brevibacterium otitidis TaxID=53364 RepID=A0ABV5WZY7_9MICO|nr:hypothetical protein GCM10023233_28420 [Brevibacterium otitidis]BFF08672.1 hypothetical protein GCM10023233_36410 [Brevibacterium otitidis]
MSFPQNPQHHENPQQQPDAPTRPMHPAGPAQQGPAQPGPAQPGPAQFGPAQPGGPGYNGPPQTHRPAGGRPGKHEVRVDPATAFRPENVSSSARTGIRTVVAIVAVLAIVVPLSIGSVIFAEVVRTHQYTDLQSFAPTSDELLVDMPVGRVEVVTGEVSEVEVAFEFVGTTENPSLSIDEDDQRTRISVEHAEETSRTSGHYDSFLSVTVPEKEAETMGVEVRSDLAALWLSGTFETVTASSGIGAIDASDLTTKKLSIDSGTGAISLDGRHEVVEVSSDLGAVNASDLVVTDQLSVDTESGLIDVSLDKATLPRSGVDLSTENGFIDLAVPRIGDVVETDAVGYTVSSTGSGLNEINIDSIPLSKDQTTVPLNLRSSGGDVTVVYRDLDDYDDSDDGEDADGEDADGEDADEEGDEADAHEA